MRSNFTILAGPARSGKTRQLLDRYARSLAELPIGGTIWLAPTGRSVRDVREKLVGLRVKSTFRPGIFTFASFAEAVLEQSSVSIRLITDGMKRELLRRLV